MTLKDLEYYVEIAQNASITRAAKSLFVAQPALSQCVQKLEHEIGTELFVRSSSGVQLTSEGTCFLEFAETVLQKKAELDKKIQDVKNADNGEIRLGFTGSQANQVLPFILPIFKKKHPNVNIILVESASDEIEQKLIHHELDIGILHPPILRSELDYFELSRDNMVIIPRTNSNYQKYVYYKNESAYIDLEFLKEEPICLTKPWQRSCMVANQIFVNAGIVPKIMQTSKNLATLDAMAQVDFATVIMPEKQVSLKLRERARFRIEETVDVPFTFVVAILRDAYLSTATQHMLQEFKNKQYSF